MAVGRAHSLGEAGSAALESTVQRAHIYTIEARISSGREDGVRQQGKYLRRGWPRGREVYFSESESELVSEA